MPSEPAASSAWVTSRSNARSARRDDRLACLVFDALADGTRRDVLRAVAEDGPLTATELAARLPVTRQAVSKHLGTLEAAGLVASTRVGRDVRFTFDPAPLDDAVAWISAVGERWDRRLAILQRRVSGEPRRAT